MSSINNSSIYIETERLILRPLNLSDEDDLFEYQSNPEIVKYIPWPEGGRTKEQVKESLEKATEFHKNEIINDGDFLLLAWEIKNGPNKGKVIGQSNMSIEKSKHQHAVFGYVTHQDFQKQGYAFEASHALLNYAFTKLNNIHRVVAVIDTRNPYSAKLATKLGMRLEGTFIDSEFFKGDWCSLWNYAILKKEFLEINLL